MFTRSSGILLHVTSLPGHFGTGDLGPAARQFVDFLARAGQRYWQVLPVGPTGYGHSPYQSLSVFAGNPQLISPELLRDHGWLPAEALANAPQFSATEVEFARVHAWREKLLNVAYANFKAAHGGREAAAFDAFCEAQQDWLENYALFSALRAEHSQAAWTSWEPALVHREPAALKRWAERLADRIDCERFLQFQFFKQWRALQEYADERGVHFIGDVPIFTAQDSADVWAEASLFQLDANGLPTAVAGVPPDYFSETGQRWGNPVYRWEEHERTNYAWWKRRFQKILELVVAVRIDHFRGFESYWEIPAHLPDARGGRWVASPGEMLFRSVEQAIGPLPAIAEDLGVITPEVEALRDALGFPGMRVLQFAFGDDAKAIDYQPHNYPRHCFVYTGTHDNDTAVGWLSDRDVTSTTRTTEQIARELAFVKSYLGSDGAQMHWDLIRLAWSSVADVAMAPLQDVLGLGREARMNLPGTSTGNWKWRVTEAALTPQVADRLGELTAIYGRTSNVKPWYMPRVE